ncbi:uncharacterized protein LOC112351530 [Selaginella moellendorffii]|uniref:uncharacterized protein LOC112351530 n=1 Tax=Selaginella moellendorffii TaxID=88036 RepID=UPI000D1C6F89|nr:uncharacterized protein LOC112351530 [Selaginella moellendorffii]|eukprot:XP_024545355.1 uncharacterized protein LOC112351530 [Selaginella moellendorffii]
MARIYVKPQVRSSRPHGRPRALDYTVIEQIANGIEKMVVQWNHAKESRIIRPYTSSRSNTATSSKSSARPTWKHLDQAVSSPQVVERTSTAPAAIDGSGNSNEGRTEMGSFTGSAGLLNEMVIPNFEGITRAEMVTKSQELDGVVNSSWYLKSNHVNSSVGGDLQCASSRTDRDNAQTSEDGSSAIGITPRLECAVERIQELTSTCTSYSQELPKKKATLVSIDEPVMTGASKEPAQQYADQMLHYELENDVGKDAVEVRHGSLSERTESACKESYSGDDRSTPQVLNNQVDDWTETTTIVGEENIRELISYTKKKEVTKEKEELLDDYKVKIEELQIALLECSTEYEVKIVEMKMMMLNLKSQYRQQMTTTGNAHINVKLLQPPTTKEFSLVTNNQAKQNVDFLKKQMQKLKQDKENLSRELFSMKKKQRQSEKQKKSLDDALNKVSCLRRDLARRDEEILDSHLREKEQRAQLHELHHALQNARAAQAEPGKLLALLPVLRNWLKSVKKVFVKQTFFH